MEVPHETSVDVQISPPCPPVKQTAPTTVLFVVDELCEPGGAERALLSIIRLLPSAEFRCVLVTFRLKATGIFEKLPCPTYVLPLIRTYDLNGLRVALQLRRIIRREHISIVNTFFETSDLWAGMVAKLCGVPILVSSRRDMGILRSARHELAYKVASQFCDAIITVSEKVRQRCIEHDHVPSRRVMTVHNGVDLQKVDKANTITRGMLSIGDRASIVATIAHVRKIKGLDVLIRAAAVVRSKHPDVIFLVIGDITEQDTYLQLQALRRVLHVESTVKFIGSSELVFSILKLCNVFCLPSHSEGFSNALIEAMACSKPCVATRVGGNDEAVQDGLTGFLVEPGDAASMAERICALLAEPELAIRMGQRGRRVVETKFSDTAATGQLVDIYRMLLKKKS